MSNFDKVYLFQEFIEKMKEMSGEFEENNLGKMFDEVDIDHDGNICKKHKKKSINLQFCFFH